MITLFSHQYPEQTAECVARLIDGARAAGVQVRVPPDEVSKHGLQASDGMLLGADPAGDTDLAVVLGGDGSILTALRTFAGRDVPVFAFNFGEIGFLSTVEGDALEEGLRCVISGEFEVLSMPALAIDVRGETKLGVNDISFHRRPDNRVAELGYSLRGDQLGRVRCDGLVASTPAGSTGYNLANGGPILAWGVEGFVVSFIAPHTLTARTLVVAPDDPLTVENLSGREDVEVTTDGRPACALEPGEEMLVRFEHDRFQLAQIPGSTFYHRFREKFGRLAY
jgi:NAD+ kinase